MIRELYPDNETLIAGMQASGVLRTPRIAEAFRRADRRFFVPEGFDEVLYVDAPLPIGEGQTISQPSTVAFMLELLGAGPGDRVLDIGSGSGWTTALLGEIVGESGEVTGLERQASLVEKGRRNLAPLGLRQVRIEPAGTQLGLPGETFDRILVSASAPEVPQGLFSQLKPGGVLVIPVGNAIHRFTKRPDGRIEEEVYPGFVFVPLIYEG
jgi:protein-L-isoaspartate(D-aspartate) O-methyltransferase